MRRPTALLAVSSLLACSGGFIGGTVTLIGGPAPVQGEVVLSGPVTRSAPISAEGTYAFAGLPEGEYSVAASVSSTVEGGGREQVTLGGSLKAADVDLAVEAAGTVTGLVTGTQVPLPGVTVIVADTGQQAVTGSDGRFTIPLVRVGFHWLHVAPTQFGAIDTGTFAVRFGRTTELPPIDFEKDLSDSGALKGRVVLDGAGPVEGARADLLGQTRASTTTDGNGYFAFRSIHDGSYTLTVTLARTREGSQTLRNILVDLNAVTDAGTITFTPE